jgi:hypothetical protein
VKTFELNREIGTLVEAPLGRTEMLSPDFEAVSGVAKAAGERKGKALAALDHFELMDPSMIPDQLQRVVFAVYNPQDAQG